MAELQLTAKYRLKIWAVCLLDLTGSGFEQLSYLECSIMHQLIKFQHNWAKHI